MSRGNPLTVIYTSNDLFFGVVSRENVIKSHVQVKLYVCLGACHEKMPYIHEITCLFRSVSRENAVYTSNYMFFRACHGKMPYIYTSNYMFLGACHGKMSFNAIYIHQITCLFRGVSRENVIKFHVYVNMEVNDISPDTPLKCYHLTCTCYLVARHW